MDKDELLENLKYAMKKVLCARLEGIDRTAMESSIDMFISSEASKYSSEELLEKFYTPEMSINIFMEYLAKAGALDETEEKTIH